MSGDGAPRLFVSHHSSKSEVALHVEKALAKYGVACWIAPRDVDPGESFDMAIKRAIDESAAVLLLFCSQSDKSQHVKRELILADSSNKAIIPLRLEEIAPDKLAYHLASTQWIDWLEQRDDALSRVASQAQKLSAQSGQAPSPSIATMPPPGRRRPGALYLIAAVAVIAAVALTFTATRYIKDQPDVASAPLATDERSNAIAAPPEAAAAVKAPDDVEVVAAPTEPPKPFRTSFDCTYAVTGAEKLICSDQELAMLDRQMDLSYTQLLKAAGPEAAKIELEQENWRIDTRDGCADTNCLSAVMRRRIISLNRARLRIMPDGN